MYTFYNMTNWPLATTQIFQCLFSKSNTGVVQINTFLILFIMYYGVGNLRLISEHAEQVSFVGKVFTCTL